jgi:uncharacterized membrane protein YfcA
VGSLVLVEVDVSLLSALLGLLLVVYSALSLSRPTIAIPRAWESWAGPVLGTVNGILTGMTGSFVVPGVLYLQAIGLPRDMLIQAMGMLFTVSTVALCGGGYSCHHRYDFWAEDSSASFGNQVPSCLFHVHTHFRAVHHRSLA